MRTSDTVVRTGDAITIVRGKEEALFRQARHLFATATDLAVYRAQIDAVQVRARELELVLPKVRSR